MKRSAVTEEDDQGEEQRILLVEDDLGLQKQMRWALSPYVVDLAASRTEAVEKLSGFAYRVVVLDLGLPPDENGAAEGLKTLDEILSAAPPTKVIVASGNVERANAVRSVAKGAFDFIAKPIDSDVLKLVIDRAVRMFELANHGTLFLDEIGDMPMPLQAKLLRFLQERRLERVGGRDSISVDVRLITATNQKLEKLIVEGRFREDLYYRINDVRMELPALRERETDTILLAQHFLNKFNKIFSKHAIGFTEDALDAICQHAWPGNVRELENRVKRAVIMAENKRVTAKDLDLEKAAGNKRDFNLRKQIENLEKRLVVEALAYTDGNISKAAKLLGISRPHLYSLMETK